MSIEAIEFFNNNDVADVDRLNAVIRNLKELADTRVVMKFDTPELSATRNFRIAAGKSIVIPGRASETINVSFGGFFEDTVCKPVVTATFESIDGKRALLSISDVRHTGFSVTVETASGQPFEGSNRINWSAFGF